LYFAEDNGDLICLTDNGATATPLWTQITGYTNLVSPTLGRDNTLFAVGTDVLRKVSGINTATPSEVWSANLTPLTVPLPPLVYYNDVGEATIYVSGLNGYIYAVSGDGEVLWAKLLVATSAKLALNKTGTVLYATVGNTLYALSNLGVVLWSRVVGNGMPPPSVGANGIIYVFSGSTVYAIQDNGFSSTLNWVLVLGLIPQRSISVGSNGRLYLVSNNQITAVVDNGASGTIKWLYAINPALAPNALTPITIGLDGTLYTTGDYALAVCVTDNDTTFVVNWAFQVLAGGFSSPCSIGLNKRIYFGGDHGHIIAL
jgi:hypothetical protein